jgi:2-dehydro-3-deoxyphosphooctonate aldolase (KDO 8-P synthase)
MATSITEAIWGKKHDSLFLIAGTCLVEDWNTTLQTAIFLKEWCARLAIPLIYKGSFVKANRTHANSPTGIGSRTALNMLKEVRTLLNIPVTTDVHSVDDIYMAAPYIDLIQIPAFLSRQTPLLAAAANTNKPINIKKGQFMSSSDAKAAVAKCGKTPVMVTERGTTFGYNDIVVDFRNLQDLSDFTTCIDLTHSNNGYARTLGLAAVAVGVNAIFLECHPNPEAALSDGQRMLPLAQVPALIEELTNLDRKL